MGSRAQAFDDGGVLKEYVDDDGTHFYVIQFEDGSGQILRKNQSSSGDSMAEFVSRDEPDMESLRRIDSATTFEVDEDANTQQNLSNLLRDR